MRRPPPRKPGRFPSSRRGEASITGAFPLQTRPSVAQERNDALTRLWPNSFAASDRSVLSKHLAMVTVFAGNQIIQQRTPGNYTLFIVEGWACLSLQFDPGEPNIEFLRLGHGETLGGLAIADEGNRLYTAIAEENLTALLLTRQAFYELSSRHPSSAAAILLAITKDNTRTLRKLNELIAQNTLGDKS